MDTLIKVFSVIAMVTGVIVGSYALLMSRKQPDKVRQLRAQSALFFSIAVVMALLLFL